MPVKSLRSNGRTTFLFLSAVALTIGLFIAYGAEIETAFARGLTWVFAQQRVFHRDMLSTLRHLAHNADSSTALWLIAASFTYGIFHAAGPGHGKAVVSTFLLTNKVQLRRGLCIAVGGSLLQGLSAVTIVYGMVWLFDWRTAETNTIITWSSRFSYALLVVVGAVWLVMAARLLFRAPNTTSACHHHELPDAQQLNHANTPGAIIAMMLAIGLRPCSGAVLVLIFAYTVHIPWAGVVAAMAMAVGTAITVSTLATLALKINTLLRRIAETASPEAAARSQHLRRRLAGLLSLACGTLIILFGGSLLLQSFGPRLSAGVL